jgi:F0F1-type ATP synthase membrane subunit c/vacuolar-type H+-ATPase subunit K
MEIPEIVESRINVIGAGLGIGKLVVQQWTLLLVNQKQENQTAMLIAAALIEGMVSRRYLLLNKT